MTDRDPAERLIPFGYNKGLPLGKVSDEELRGLRDWCAGVDKFDDLIEDIEQVIEDRQGLPLELDDRRPPRRGGR